MSYYRLNPPKEKSPILHRERWETFAAFLAFAALVALAGAVYGALRRGDVYAEIHSQEALSRFSGVLESSGRLSSELKAADHSFTIIAPSDAAFHIQNVEFPAAAKNSDIRDGNIVRIGGHNYILQGESYVVRTRVLPHDVPADDTLELPAANGAIINMHRLSDAAEAVITVNDVPVRERIVADNGVIYIVDSLIHPLPNSEAARKAIETTSR